MGKHSAVPASSSERGSKQTPEAFLRLIYLAPLDLLAGPDPQCISAVEALGAGPAIANQRLAADQENTENNQLKVNSCCRQPNVKWHEGC